MIDHLTRGRAPSSLSRQGRLLVAALALVGLARAVTASAPLPGAHAARPPARHTTTLARAAPAPVSVTPPALPARHAAGRSPHYVRPQHARRAAAHARAPRRGPLRVPLPADLGRWGFLPAVPGHSPQARSWLLLTVPRGYTVHTAALLLNDTPRPLPLHLFLADGHSGPDGAFRSTNLGEPVHGVGVWLRLDGPARVVVPPHSAMRLPLTLTLPRDVPVGLHAGALEARGASVAAGTANGVHLSIATQVGLRVYLTVPGRAVVAPVWSGLRCTHTAGQVLCYVTLLNRGTVPLHPRGQLRLLTPWGATAARLSLGNAGELLPADRLDLTATWAHPTLGLYHIEAALSAAGRRTTQATTVTVGPPWWTWLPLLPLALLIRAGWRRRRRLRSRLRAATHAWRTAPEAPPTVS